MELNHLTPTQIEEIVKQMDDFFYELVSSLGNIHPVDVTAVMLGRLVTYNYHCGSTELFNKLLTVSVEAAKDLQNQYSSTGQTLN